MTNLPTLPTPIANQIALEQRYSKSRIRSMVLADIHDCEEILAKVHMCVVSIEQWLDEDHYQQKADSLEAFRHIDIEEMLVDILGLILTAYPPFVYFELTAVIGLVNKCLPHTDDNERIKRCGEIMYHMANCDLIGMRPAYASATGTITVSNKYGIGGDTAKYITLSRFTPPMICKPQIVTDATESGYYLNQGNGVLKRKHLHKKYINLHAINKFNQTALTLDVELMMMVDDELKDRSIKDKPSGDIEDKEKEFEKFKLSTAEVCAEIVHAGNECHLTHFYCGRGRTYSRGYHINYQGNSFRKAKVNFKESAEITITDEERSFFEIGL